MFHMSVVEHKKTLIELRSKKSAYAITIDSLDSNPTRFHLILYQDDKIAYLTAYPLRVKSGGSEFFYNQGYVPKYGLLFPCIDKEKIQEIKNKTTEMTRKKPYANELISFLSKILETEENKIKTLIHSNWDFKRSRSGKEFLYHY